MNGLVDLKGRALLTVLVGSSADQAETKKQSGQVTRRLQLLRAHGLIQKVPKSHRYKITVLGSKLAAAVSYASDSSLKNLSQAA